jgi:hypothetical protein
MSEERRGVGEVIMFDGVDDALFLEFSVQPRRVRSIGKMR